MIAAFNSMLGGTFSDASQVSSDHFETSEQNPGLSAMSATCDHLGIQSAIPKAHQTPYTMVRVMRNAMKTEWIKSQTSKIDGLWRRGVFQKVLRSSLTPRDRVFRGIFGTK